MNIQDMIDEIQLGHLDANLDTLERAIRLRRQQRTPSALDGLMTPRFMVGMKVRFKDNTHPTYLRGATATITKVNQKRVKVKLDCPAGRFGEADINAPLNLLEAA